MHGTIDYRLRFTTHRQLNPIDNLDYSVESDRGRILSSAAFRRLQKRTQVFALELNASIRTRLTHSLEVAQTARFIAKSILQRLERERGLAFYGLTRLENAFVSTAEMASLLHDIGNPPFGHFAEETINRWIETKALGILSTIAEQCNVSNEIRDAILRDACSYDGNAQAMRLIDKLQRLNLSYTQMHAVLKYTRGAFEPKPASGEALGYLRKKPGYYFSESESIARIKEALGIAEGHRHPTTYIMEAADDIAYLTADLEDAVDKGVLSLDTLYDLIMEACEDSNETWLKKIVEEQYDKAKSDDAPYRFNMFFTLLRARLITKLVAYVAEVYVKHHEALFVGEFNASLLEFERNNPYAQAIAILRDISWKHIYRAKSVQRLELQGYTIVTTLLDRYGMLLELDAEAFARLLDEGKSSCFLCERLIGRIGAKQIAAYRSDLKRYEKKSDFALVERYLRLRLLVDFISGMTDDYALYEYRTLNALTES